MRALLHGKRNFTRLLFITCRRRRDVQFVLFEKSCHRKTHAATTEPALRRRRRSCVPQHRYVITSCRRVEATIQVDDGEIVCNSRRPYIRFVFVDADGVGSERTRTETLRHVRRVAAVSYDVRLHVVGR